MSVTTARQVVATGGQVLLVPTNAASFSNAQMPALELGAARLRAIETGRTVVQAAPTGLLRWKIQIRS